MYQHLLVERDGPVLRLTLNRPEVRNAFNERLIVDLHRFADEFAREPGGARVVVLSGAGQVFCAGADLESMARTADLTRDDNVADAARMGAMFRALDRLPVPLVGRVQGAAMGGGAGLVAVCDVVVARRDTIFAFSEVKLGIVPAVISPFVVAKIGRSAARALFLTGARFGADRAAAIGLVHEVVGTDDLEATIEGIVQEVLAAGPQAVAAAKELIAQVSGLEPEEAEALTAKVIAARRASAEGREGIRAFLEKRRPRWMA